MSTNQLFFSLIGVMAAFAGFFKYWIDAKFEAVNVRFDDQQKYMDARFEAQQRYMDARFTSIDNQLKFIVDHLMEHESRISKLEAK